MGTTKLPLDSILKQSLALLKGHWNLFLTIFLVTYLPMSLIGTAIPEAELVRSPEGSFPWIPFSGFLFFMCWGFVAIIDTACLLNKGTQVEISQSLVRTIGKVPLYFMVILTLFLMAMLGAMLLIVPGVYLLTVFSLVPIIVIAGDVKGNPYKQSFRLVKGYVRNLLVINLIFALGLSLFVVAEVLVADFGGPVMVLLLSPFEFVWITWFTVFMVILYAFLTGKSANT